MANSKIKILFILPSLRAGGAERVISFISNNIDKSKFEPVLIVFGFEKDNSYSIKDTTTIYLNKSRLLNSVFPLYNYIRKNNPDIIMSSIGHVNILMGIFSLLLPKSKFIAREATVSGKRKETKSLKSKLSSKLIKLIYPLLNKIICQSEDMKNDLISTYNIPLEKIVIINNPITNNKEKENLIKINNPYEPIKYITIGRLAEVKGHLRILKVLSKLTFDFTYTIIGEGPLKDEIFRAIKCYHMTDKVIYIPYTNEVYKYLFHSDLFLQGSYVEGFPNAVLESCAVGTPVLAFNAPGGTKEIILDNVNGFIVNTEEEFLEKLNKKYDWNSDLIKDHVYQKFNKDKIINQYTVLFLEV